MVNVNAGTLNVSNAFTQAGTLQVGGGGATFSKAGGFTNNGNVTGSGTVDVTGGTLTNSGTIRPDGGGLDATGTLNVTGNFVQTSTGVLDFQAEGTAAGTFDRLAISGTAALAGTMRLNTASGFTPSANQNFDLLTYLSSSGAFTTIEIGRAHV